MMQMRIVQRAANIVGSSVTRGTTRIGSAAATRVAAAATATHTRLAQRRLATSSPAAPTSTATTDATAQTTTSTSSSSSSSSSSSPPPPPSRRWIQFAVVGGVVSVLAAQTIFEYLGWTRDAAPASERHMRGESRKPKDVLTDVFATVVEATMDVTSCRACREGGDANDINNFYRKQADTQAKAQAAAALAATAAANGMISPATAAAAADPAAVAAATANAAANNTAAAPTPFIVPAANCPPCYAYSHGMCPLNRAEVGRAAWGYLHTMVAYYPDKPSPRQQADMAQFLNLFMKLYPCGYCADRSMEQLEREPIEEYVGSQQALTAWMCRAHNEVNERLGKPIFNCQYVNERWRDGPPTGECD